MKLPMPFVVKKLAMARFGVKKLLSSAIVTSASMAIR